MMFNIGDDCMFDEIIKIFFHPIKSISLAAAAPLLIYLFFGISILRGGREWWM